MDENTNPATQDGGTGTQAPVVRDANSNPATFGQKIGGETAPNPQPGVVQTTIHPNSTIHPDSSIVNPVSPDGGPAPNVKRAEQHPAVTAMTDARVKEMQQEAAKSKSAALGGVSGTGKTGNVK